MMSRLKQRLKTYLNLLPIEILQRLLIQLTLIKMNWKVFVLKKPKLYQLQL